MLRCTFAVALLGLFCLSSANGGEDPGFTTLEHQFRDVPMAARRNVQPLFWLHGDESKERLELLIQKMVDAHCGGFVCESRPHNDFLGPNWYRDLDICLAAAKKHNLKMWIFDEKWWPSQTIGGKVPPQYAAKKLIGEAFPAEGGARFAGKDFGGPNFVAAVAGKEIEGGIDGSSLIDLSPQIKDGTLAWDPPAGQWKVMKFTWKMSPVAGQGKDLTLDGASKDCVDWYIQTVYQPHYDRYKEDFGKTIVGYFYDEPEVHGDWGTEVLKMLTERKIDWKKPLVAWKFTLAGDEQIAAKYQYQDALFEAWGRTLYGGLQKWCAERNVDSIGHFIEHGAHYLKWGGWAPGNMFQLQKYSAMGGIDNVFNQFRIGDRVGRGAPVFQTTKLGSSISHVYGKKDQVAFCEIFGADGQDLAYSNMKWQADQHQVRGINFMVPHSFNPRAPFDTDCPPYFYNGGYEPRYPLFRVWADYTNRLSVLLAGGKHVCPVATIVCGNSIYAGKAIIPDQITDVLDDIQFDSDWMPYDAFDAAKIIGKELHLFEERYKVLIAPPAEVIPLETLTKLKAFFDSGGTVIGYGYLPVKSATLGAGSKEIAALREAIWGAGEIAPSTSVCKTNPAGGRSYFLPAKPSQDELRRVMADSGIRPTLEVLEGKTDNWLHVLHRVKSGRDVMFIANQNHKGEPRKFRFRAHAAGEPECWDAMRAEISSIPYKRVGAMAVEFELEMRPSESVLIVFQPKPNDRPARVESLARASREAIPVTRVNAPTTQQSPPAPLVESKPLPLEGVKWVWFPEGEPHKQAPPGTRYFRRSITLPADRKVKSAVFKLTADNGFDLRINGKTAGQGNEWHVVSECNVATQLSAGENVLAIAATNGEGPINPAGLVGELRIEFQAGEPMIVRIDSSWKCANSEQPNWDRAGFDDKAWVAARETVKYGEKPWAQPGRPRLTLGPVIPDPFIGRCTIPADLDLKRYRIYLEMDELPDQSAAVTVNGATIGGVIGQPLRVNVTAYVKAGPNTFEIAPLAPKRARLLFYDKVLK